MIKKHFFILIIFILYFNCISLNNSYENDKINDLKIDKINGQVKEVEINEYKINNDTDELVCTTVTNYNIDGNKILIRKFIGNDKLLDYEKIFHYENNKKIENYIKNGEIEFKTEYLYENDKIIKSIKYDNNNKIINYTIYDYSYENKKEIIKQITYNSENIFIESTEQIVDYNYKNNLTEIETDRTQTSNNTVMRFIFDKREKGKNKDYSLYDEYGNIIEEYKTNSTIEMSFKDGKIKKSNIITKTKRIYKYIYW